MVRLDTSVKSFRLDAGVKTPVAVDLVSGKTFVKVATSMPWSRQPSKSLPSGHAVLQLASDPSTLHQDHSDDEWFRGVWKEDDTPAASAKTPASPKPADPKPVDAAKAN